MTTVNMTVIANPATTQDGDSAPKERGKEMGKSVDEMLEDIGQLGRFQISRLVMFCLIVFPPTFQLLNMFFIGAEAPWKCAANSTSCTLNGTFVVGDAGYDFRCHLNKSEWEYASYEGPSTSIISEFNLVCDDAYYGWLAKAMTYIGMSCFTIPLGMLADRYGRLAPLFPSITIVVVVGFASSFATQYWQLLLSRFVVGSFLYGVLFPIFILSGEFVGPRYRPIAQTVMWFAFSTVLLIMAGMAYFVREWRTLMILCTAPCLVLLVLWKFIPESIRWYMTHDKVEKAEDTLRKIAEVNKTKYPNEHLSVPETTTRSLGCLALFSTWPLAKSSLVQAFAWFINGMVYYGASYGASDLGGSMYLNFVLTSLVEIPANVLVVDNCQRFGRKRSVIVHMILGGVACFVVSLIPGGTERTDYIVGRVIGGMLGKGFITASFNAIYIWSGEIFPTVVRNSGLGFVGVFSRLGAVSAPFVVEAKRIHQTVPFGIMGALAVTAALLCLILPETRGKPTVETIKREPKEDEDVVLNGDRKDSIETGPAGTFTMTQI